MKYDPLKHHRRSIRLKGYDYSRAGAYFVTICTRGLECVLDDPVVAGIIGDVWMALPRWFPTIALDEFVVMPNHVHFIVWLQPGDDGAGAMPAGAMRAGAMRAGAMRAGAMRAGAMRAGASPAPTMDDADVGATLAVAPEVVALCEWTIPEPESINSKPTLSDVMGAFKSLVFTVYYDWVQARDPSRRAKFWQRNYYEHIVRNERELRAIRRYIRHNPLQWALGRDNPHNLKRLPPPARVEDYLAEIELFLREQP